MLMDIANAFAAVAPNQYGKVCQKLKFLKELVHWFLNFLKDRKFQLTFDGEIHVKMKINAGIPQGSPVSSIIFLIYISYIFISLDPWKDCAMVSFYINDVVIITNSKSLLTNSQRLQTIIKRLFGEATQSHVKFDMGKTEFIHFYRKRESGFIIIFTAGNIINTVESKDSVR